MTVDEADKTRMEIERDLARVTALMELDDCTLTEKFDIDALRTTCGVFHDDGWKSGYLSGLRFGTVICARYLASLGLAGVAMEMLRAYEGQATKPEAA
jgi:hypothetical protein